MSLLLLFPSIPVSGNSISPTGLSSDETFGQVSFLTNNTLLITSKTSDLAFGSLTLNTRTRLFPTSLGADESFGSFQLSSKRIIQPSSHVQIEQFGQFVFGSKLFISPSSLASGFNTGNPNLVIKQFLFFLGSSFTEFGQFTLNLRLPVAGDNIFEWFETRVGVQGSKLDRLKEYLNSQGYTGNSNTMLFKFLRAQGYRGSLAQMISNFERQFTNRYGPP